MRTSQSHQSAHRRDTNHENSRFEVVMSSAMAALLALAAFHLSLVSTALPPSPEQMVIVGRAIDILDAKGFRSEALVLRHAATFRETDNWLNAVAHKENAFAATNFPFGIVTVYRDFYSRATDDTERAAILLHEAQHIMGKDERAAYEFVWLHRAELGWTQLAYGTSPTYVTIEQQTRDYAPALFNCPSNLWSDCTETLRAGK
jgi:Zn-dependent protease with chaperone function